MNSPEITRTARHAIRIYADYVAAGVTEHIAQGIAIKETVDELKDEPDLLPPNRDERDWERGGFAPGRAGWEGEIDG